MFNYLLKHTYSANMSQLQPDILFMSGSPYALHSGKYATKLRNIVETFKQSDHKQQNNDLEPIIGMKRERPEEIKSDADRYNQEISEEFFYDNVGHNVKV